jgi:phosphoglucomutase
VPNPSNWSAIHKDIELHFSELSANVELVEKAVKSLETWIAQPLFAAHRDPILAHVTNDKYALLLDSFYQLVPFGTGGRRGRVGYGPNRINQLTVAMSVQGHCNYLSETLLPSQSRKIIMAFDTRIFVDIAKTYTFLGPQDPLLGLTSRALARIASEIYAANGFDVYIAGLNLETQYLSTPELSFAIRELNALGGMNVSASHNHPDDNGFKFFNEEGAQDIPPVDQKMASYMGEVQEIKKYPFADAVAAGLIHALPEEIHPEYIRMNLELRRKEVPPLNIVYTPLCGTGDSTVGDVLRAAGHHVQLFAPQANFDGSFAAIPLRLPNPEVPEAASPALKLAKETDADMVFATDPDADRLGLYAKSRDGQWRYVNGNEIASILAYYLVLDHARGPQRQGFLIKTLVTTRTLQKIAERSGRAIVSDLMVGFKYIANVLSLLEQERRFKNVEANTNDLILAAEESHGVLLTPKVRDKDAAGGALILCELVSQLKNQNKYLPEYLNELSLECGNHQNASRSIVMRGIKGASLLSEMMRSLREKPPEAFYRMPVLRSEDFLSASHGPLRSETERLSRNLLLYELENAQIVIRPSGTEPKAKIYVDVEGSKLSESDRKGVAQYAQKMAISIVEDCILRIGFHLSASASILPDYIDLDLKSSFDTHFRKDLLDSASSLSRLSSVEQLAWLRNRLAAYGAGADPLAATSDAVAHLIETLSKESTDASVRKTFDELAQVVLKDPAPADWIR